jgi:hypothetical protein
MPEKSSQSFAPARVCWVGAIVVGLVLLAVLLLLGIGVAFGTASLLASVVFGLALAGIFGCMFVLICGRCPPGTVRALIDAAVALQTDRRPDP